ncbi:MAG: GIY-YIG nuclease family protein [Hyphomicrobiaceae bacterium]|nr:GIY-YIG nuclease family protein [Hyphomicrobiaceae bacterium]
MRVYWVYILASQPRGTLYIGVTNGLIKRIDEHRAGVGSKFTAQYKVHRLVWYEELSSITEAIQRETSLKRYARAWKINLVERGNPHWVDLYPSLPGVAPVPKAWRPLDDGSSGQARG